MNRALLSFAILMTLAGSAAAQRFAGVMDASGMVNRPVASPTVAPIPGLPQVFLSGAMTPATGPGFFTPGTAPSVVLPTTLGGLNNVVQPIFVPAPVTVVPGEIIEEVPASDELLGTREREALMLGQRRSTVAAPLTSSRATETASVAAGGAGIAVGRCQAAALQQLRALNVRAEALQLGRNTTGWSPRMGADEVRGRGALLDANRGKWRRFSYFCQSTSSSGQTRAAVTLEP